jgi:8-oxo-dGTP diphosphatase
MQHYVLGFAFDYDIRVTLIKKDRPDWMAGKWNGVGGKIEPGEDPHAAMAREFREETGVSIFHTVWQKFAILRDKQAGFEIDCFVTILPPSILDEVRSPESEEVRIFDGDVLVRPDLDLMPNLRWLLPMSLTLSETDIPVLIEYGFKAIDARGAC